MSTKNTITSKTPLKIGDSIHSKNNQYKLTLEKSGKLVIYFSSPKGPFKTWESSNKPTTAVEASVDQDGNLSLKDASGTIVWETGTSFIGSKECRLFNNGDLAIFNTLTGKRHWHSGTHSFVFDPILAMNYPVFIWNNHNGHFQFMTNHATRYYNRPDDHCEFDIQPIQSFQSFNFGSLDHYSIQNTSNQGYLTDSASKLSSFVGSDEVILFPQTQTKGVWYIKCYQDGGYFGTSASSLDSSPEIGWHIALVSEYDQPATSTSGHLFSFH